MTEPSTWSARKRKAWRTLRNSRLSSSKKLFAWRVTDEDFDRALRAEARASGHEAPLWARIRRRARPWFWPSIDDADDWTSAAVGGRYDPRQYLRSEPRRPLARLLTVTPPTDSVLDLGCNSGADLNILFQAGFHQLYGVDASGAALRLFQTEYPETFAHANVRHDLFQRYLMNSPDGFVDVLHSHGATLELVHPSFPLISEICRVVRKSVFIDVLENGHAYARNYIRDFERHGFRLVYCERDAALYYSSLLEFRRIEPSST